MEFELSHLVNFCLSHLDNRPSEVLLNGKLTGRCLAQAAQAAELRVNGSSARLASMRTRELGFWWHSLGGAPLTRGGPPVRTATTELELNCE
jgi:hypothetical protein